MKTELRNSEITSTSKSPEFMVELLTAPAVVKVKLFSRAVDIPQYQTDGAAGADLYAAIEHDVKIEPGKWALIPTGVCIELPEGYQAEVRSRSGLALKHGIFVLNSPGTIDCDYRGEIGVILANFSDKPFIVKRGDRIAQLVIARYEKVEFKHVDYLEESMRNSNGFGSTGL